MTADALSKAGQVLQDGHIELTVQGGLLSAHGFSILIFLILRPIHCSIIIFFLEIFDVGFTFIACSYKIIL